MFIYVVEVRLQTEQDKQEVEVNVQQDIMEAKNAVEVEDLQEEEEYIHETEEEYIHKTEEEYIHETEEEYIHEIEEEYIHDIVVEYVHDTEEVQEMEKDFQENDNLQEVENQMEGMYDLGKEKRRMEEEEEPEVEVLQKNSRTTKGNVVDDQQIQENDGIQGIGISIS